jgi:integrase
MTKKVERLSAIAVTKARAPGLYPDGAGLYLRVGRGGAKSWAFRFMLDRKAREMGLGGLTKVSLSDARKKAVDARLLLSDGKDPLTAKTDRTAAQRVEAARAMTFDDCAEAYIKAHAPSWKNAKHRQQWENTLSTYVTPVFGSIGVAEVDVAVVMKVIEPLWSTKTETAGRVRARIETVLDWAKARGYRIGENPARWRGHLDQLLPKKSKVRKVRHHPALPHDELGAFMQDLRAREGVATAALEFLILTVGRTNEVIGARWSEVDAKGKVWIVPAERMKADRDHRVPLSAPALAVLEHLNGQGGDFIFPGLKAGKPLSNMAMLNLIGRMNGDRREAALPLYVDPKRSGAEVTPHGFRSTFKDWARERTNFQAELSEAALAHAIGDKTEAAYARGDLFDKRRRLMDTWAEFSAKPTTSASLVVNIRRQTSQ